MRYLCLAYAIPYPPKKGFVLRCYDLARELTRRHAMGPIAFIAETLVKADFPGPKERLAESRLALRQRCGSVTLPSIDSMKRLLGRQLAMFQARSGGTT